MIHSYPPPFLQFNSSPFCPFLPHSPSHLPAVSLSPGQITLIVLFPISLHPVLPFSKTNLIHQSGLWCFQRPWVSVCWTDAKSCPTAKPWLPHSPPWLSPVHGLPDHLLLHEVTLCSSQSTTIITHWAQCVSEALRAFTSSGRWDVQGFNEEIDRLQEGKCEIRSFWLNPISMPCPAESLVTAEAISLESYQNDMSSMQGTHRAGEITQWVKCLIHKHEDFPSDLQHPQKQ